MISCLGAMICCHFLSSLHGQIINSFTLHYNSIRIQTINLASFLGTIFYFYTELLLQVAIPPEAEFVPLKPMTEKPAKEYPFILDPFQKEALLCLENNQSVLVSAHTSAGKTVVAV